MLDQPRGAGDVPEGVSPGRFIPIDDCGTAAAQQNVLRMKIAVAKGCSIRQHGQGTVGPLSFSVTQSRRHSNPVSNALAL
jgi:hypothetical protein